MSNNQSCSEYSRSMGESMLGTAPRVDFWILLEYSQKWTRDPTTNNTLSPQVQDWLHNTITTLEEEGRFPRVQMIRRGRQDLRETGHTLFVAESGALRKVMLHSYDEILNLGPIEQVGEVVETNVYFVCTHGTRDRCCAKFGIHTWKVLNELSNNQCWQCSHLGGHRFAPNVLVLPHGRLYGRVYEEDAESFYRTVEAREIATKNLRGKSELTAEDQVQETGITPVRTNAIQIRASCDKEILKTVCPFSDS